MNRLILNKLNIKKTCGTPVALVTELGSGKQTVIEEPDNQFGDNLPSKIAIDARMFLLADINSKIEYDNKTYFVQSYNPPVELYIVGAVHITQSLAYIANISGYNVNIVDPRRGFANSNRFPDVEISNEWPDDYFKDISLTNRAAIITLSHDPKIDDPALEYAIESPVFYIGSLGSKRTHSKRLSRLKKLGFSENQLNRIHSPVGFDIGAKSPAEIAISIMAEITHVRNTVLNQKGNIS